MNINPDKIFDQIKDIIIKTLISSQDQLCAFGNRPFVSRNNFFELYGFDILIDANLKAWLLEVNVSPSLNVDSPLDRKIKTTLICDMFNLIGF
jgi:hypothetical protein